MTLLITFAAAVVSTIIWYLNDNRKVYMLGTLPLIYWGASLMWTVDFAAEYSELKSEYFNQSFDKILNDSVLGAAAILIGLSVWIFIVLIKDPKNLFNKSNKK